MSEILLLYVLRVVDLDRALTFYRDMLRFRPICYDPEQGTARLMTPDGGKLLLTSNPDLDVAALFASEETTGKEEEEGFASGPLKGGWETGTAAPSPEVAVEEIPDLFETPEPTGERKQASPPEIREVDKEEILHFPGEDLLVCQERLTAFGIQDLLLEEYPGVEQVLKMRDPEGYQVHLHESLRLPDDEVISLYRKGPDLLDGAILGLEEEDLDLKTPEGETLRQLILQIIDFDLEMMQRMKWALAENGRSYTIPLYHPEEWAENLHYATRTVHVEVSLFRLLREHILNQVEVIPEALDHHLVSEQGSVEVRTMMQVTMETIREQIQTILETRSLHGK